jgi:hypothetical protein
MSQGGTGMPDADFLCGCGCKQPTEIAAKTRSELGWIKGSPKRFIHGHNVSLAAQARLGRSYPGSRPDQIEQWQGARNPNWKGGIAEQNQQFRKTPEYKQWRITVFERDNYTCQECKTRGGNLNADHIMPFADYPKLRLDIDNGRTLCVTCHRLTPSWGMNQYVR